MVFQRVIGQSEMYNSDAHAWKDSSDCWVCEKHNKIVIEMNSLTEIVDEEFQEVMQISQVLNNDQGSSAPLGAPSQPLDGDGNLKPVYEDMLEELFESQLASTCSNGRLPSASATDSSSEHIKVPDNDANCDYQVVDYHS